MFSSVDLSQPRPDHLQIDILPIQKDYPKDSAMAVMSVFLDLNGLVQDQPCKMFRGSLTEGLPWLPLFLSFLRGVNADEPNGQFSRTALHLGCLAVNNLGDFLLGTKDRLG